MEEARQTKVQVLDETTANQIAAGEVIERPAAAVKELVENALDADARRVLVELEEGGKYLLRVTDDGAGMGQEDAILSLQRHATSKIRNSDDLFRIVTMGFRGEALPSIASVAQMTIITKEAEDALAGTPSMEYMWCPFLIAWAAKSLVIRYGGVKIYRQAVPLALGLILGDYIVPTLWGIWGMIERTQVYMAFPH